ncbi:polysaccharide biosynthesis protein [Paenibacillus thermotolerans]|uniref:polysaccharide biosynthesis protein n=1 Tax=Paenibacillus thermotolerans TaxID=3027807 RepID=UPI002368DBE9|nr:MULTISPECIES: nucleoside-diphosphate sugar epimerase/dehydratase [unclassified Paenibacillus]
MNQVKRKLILMIIDSMIVGFSVYCAYLLRFDFAIKPQFISTMPLVISCFTLFTVLSLYVNKIYKKLWQYASVGDLLSIFKGTVTGTAVCFVVYQFLIKEILHSVVIPRSVFIMTFIITLMGIAGSRFLWRIIQNNYSKLQPYHHKALVIGAGETGLMVVRELKQKFSEFYPVAFIDDNERKKNLEVSGVPVVGNRLDIPEVVKRLDIKVIILAIPSATRLEISNILEICKLTGCQIKIIPRVSDFLSGKISLNQIRDVSVEDLLGREPVSVDLQEITSYVTNKVVLITGAGGSIGSELSRQIAGFQPKLLLLLGHGENSIYEIELELRKLYSRLKIEAIIADIQDKSRIQDIFNSYKPQVIFHAAAHKHVPMMEKNPAEAVKNNIIGTFYLTEAAHKVGAERFVMISSDKAVNPTNVMGATKRAAEIIVQSFNNISATKYTAVRFGNVLGSRGSVIPVFKRQINEGGPVTVTHPEMVRYFMTIPEAVQLVIQAGAFAQGGEVFILDMGKPVKIDDLARDLIRLSGLEPDVDIKILYTGIRPGEKLFEELLSNDEGAAGTKHNRVYIGKATGMPFEEMLEMVGNFERVFSGVNGEEVRLLLKKWIPTYQYFGDQLSNEQIKEAISASLEIVASLDKKEG